MQGQISYGAKSPSPLHFQASEISVVSSRELKLHDFVSLASAAAHVLLSLPLSPAQVSGPFQHVKNTHLQYFWKWWQSQEWGKRLQLFWFGHCEQEWATTSVGVRQRIKKTHFPLSLQLPLGTFGLSLACYYQDKTGHSSGREILGRSVWYLGKFGCLRVAECQFPHSSPRQCLRIMNYVENGIAETLNFWDILQLVGRWGNKEVLT